MEINLIVTLMAILQALQHVSNVAMPERNSYAVINKRPCFAMLVNLEALLAPTDTQVNVK